MRAANYSSMNIFSLEQIKEINNIIKLNFIKGSDNYAQDSVKTSDVKFVNYGKIQKQIFLTLYSSKWLAPKPQSSRISLEKSLAHPQFANGDL